MLKDCEIETYLAICDKANLKPEIAESEHDGWVTCEFDSLASASFTGKDAHQVARFLSASMEGFSNALESLATLKQAIRDGDLIALNELVKD